MKKSFLSFLCLALLIVSCTMQNKNHNENASGSFIPMQIGNYWKVDAQNYTEIKDTLRIDGKLYYQFYSLVGGDAVSKVFLRINEKKSWQNPGLLQKVRNTSVLNLEGMLMIAFTLNDKTTNDYKVTIIEKSDRKMTFSFDMIYHDNFERATTSGNLY